MTDSKTLVDRLRAEKDYRVVDFTPVSTTKPLCGEAADYIERLEAALLMDALVERLRGAFDTDSVPEKNLAIRKAHDLIETQAREIERLREAIKRGNGAYQVSLADQAKARREAKQLIDTIEVLLKKHEAYHNSIEHAAARQLLRKIRGEA